MYKRQSDISWETFNFLLEKVAVEDTIGHLYIADIEFDIKNASTRELTYNEIYPPVIQKQKIIDLCERSVFELLEQYIHWEKGPKSYKSAAKAHTTLLKKKFLPMYFEDLAICIKIAGSKITKIYLHFTFEQARFKRKFILMIQKSRQQSKNDIEKDFYKLMTNSNFGYDCRIILITVNLCLYLMN